MGLQSPCPECGFQTMDHTPSEIWLNGIRFSLFKDYVDKNALKALSFGDKIKYLEARAKLVFLDPLEEMVYLEKFKKSAKYHLLNLVTIITCAIEGLGRYLTSENYYPAFKEFIKEFMDSGFSKQYQGEEYSKIVWKYFRNGLAHGLCIEWGGIERFLGCYFKIYPQIGLQVDTDYLIEDFKRAFDKFIYKLQEDGDSGKFAPHFLQRFEDVFCK